MLTAQMTRRKVMTLTAAAPAAAIPTLVTPKSSVLGELISRHCSAWNPPKDVEPEAGKWSDIFNRESERASIVMGKVAGELVHRWPDHLATRHNLLSTLADWHSHCDDNPELASTLLRLVLDSKHHRTPGWPNRKEEARQRPRLKLVTTDEPN